MEVTLAFLPDLLNKIQEQYPLDERHYYTIVLRTERSGTFGVYVWDTESGPEEFCAFDHNADLFEAFRRCHEEWLNNEECHDPVLDTEDE